MTDAAADAKIPLVYVNRQPVNVDTLPANQAFVASNEADSGTLETKQICKLLKEAGKGRAPMSTSWKASSPTRPPCSAPRTSTT